MGTTETSLKEKVGELEKKLQQAEERLERHWQLIQTWGQFFSQMHKIFSLTLSDKKMIEEETKEAIAELEK